MKNIAEYINEDITNESIAGIAGGIIVGCLGYNLVKGIINGLISVGAYKLINKHNERIVSDLESEWIPELERLLSDHPKSYHWAKSYWKKNDVESLLKRMNGTLGALTFVDEVLSKDEWSEEDAIKFKELWDKAFNATKAIQKQLSDELMKLM